jgi:curved DNA-binding protein CbpA
MNYTEEAYKILRVKSDSSWEQILSQYRLLAAMWNPDRVNDEVGKKYTQEEFDKINWAKSYLEHNEERVLRLEYQKSYRLDLKAESLKLGADESAYTTYFPKAHAAMLGEQLLYVGAPALVNRFRAFQGWEKIWELTNSSPRYWFNL